MKNLFKTALYLIPLVLISCHTHRADPPDHWIKKTNNNVIGQISFDNNVFNCAETAGKHVICVPNMDTLDHECAVFVTFTDGSARERWSKSCPDYGTTDTLLFDDGQFTYFYGTKAP